MKVPSGAGTTLHVDDVKSIHQGKQLVETFEQWIDFMYGYPYIVKLKSLRGKVHEYVSMTLDYATRGEVNIDKRKYVKR